MLNQVNLISNIYFEPYWRDYIKDSFSLLSFDIHANFISYDEFYDNTNNIEKSDIVAVCLNLDMLYPNLSIDTYSGKVEYEDIEKDCIQKCRGLYSFIRERTNAHIIWFGFEDYFCLQNSFNGSLFAFGGLVDRINLMLKDMLHADLFIDLKRLIATLGIARSYDFKSRYRWNAPYSKDLIYLMAEEVHRQYLIVTGITKKCLVLDCDNVLWGGILSEDGIENLKLSSSGLGRIYQDFQRFILELYYHGVILAICSKNDLSDVMIMFREHSEMVLKEEHISCFQVDWNNKPDNIKKISETLNIGLDSIVFIDDSPIEIEAVNIIMPEVATILYEHDNVYGKFSLFNLQNNINISDIIKRNKTYQTNQYRKFLKAQYKNYSEYINALEMKIDIHKTLPIEYSRISELTQRTNKCTNGIRYTISDIKRRISTDNVSLYSIFVSDCFSDLGLVGVFEIDGETLTLFNLSCRALGRKIESEMLTFISNKHRIKKVAFKSTGKNEDIKSLLLNAFSGAKITF